MSASRAHRSLDAGAGTTAGGMPAAEHARTRSPLASGSRRVTTPVTIPVVAIRAIASSDAAAYQSILERTSEEDRYCRFFHVVNHFDLSDVRRFVEPRSDTIGFIAQAGGKPLGVAHAFFTDAETAEIAIVVAGDARLRGIGRALLKRLIDELGPRGIRVVVAFSMATNGSFSNLARSVGMKSRESVDDQITWSLTLPIR